MAGGALKCHRLAAPFFVPIDFRGVRPPAQYVMAESSDKKPSPIGGELLLPIVAVLFSIYYFTTITDVPFSAQVSALFVGTVLIFLCILLFLRTYLSVRRGESTLGIGGLIEPLSYIPTRLTLLALTIGYVFLVQWLGFTLTTFLFLSLSMMLLNKGRRKGFIIGLAATLSISGWLLFIYAFETRFPAGPFEMLMAKVL